MGRRKHKNVAFVQGSTLAEELEASSTDDEDPGGLHIGGIVIRAPARSRAAEQQGRGPRRQAAAAPGSSSRPAGTRSRSHQLQQAETEHFFASEDSLDDELRDYLDNVKQHDEEDSEETSEQDRAAAAAAPAQGQQSSRRHAAAAILDSSSSEDWEDLGSRPGLGFAGCSAAARFAAVSLDDALEGNLGSDMRHDYTSSSSDSDSSSDSSGDDPDTGSSSDNGDAVQLNFASLDASAAVVVDPQGRPMALWESLSLQQRFPVQARCETDTRKGSSRRKRQQQKRRTPSRTSSGNAESLPADAPAFECDVTAAAARAAHAAALCAADIEAAQRQQRRQQQKSLAKGAQRGQLLPGEKKRLRKEKIAAKRCARRGERGQGALALLAAVERFALGGGDMEVLPPCGKHKQAFVRNIATLYGVRASAQGGSSSGRTCLVLASTPDAAPPAADAAAQLQALLTAELTREVVAAAIAAGPGERPASAAAAAGGQQGGSTRQRRTPQRQGSRGAAGTNATSAFQQPVAFVSAGTLDPNSSSSSRTVEGDAQQEVPACSTIFLPAAAAAAASEPAGSDDLLVGSPTTGGAVAATADRNEEDVVPQVEAAAAAAARAAAATAGVGEFLQPLLLDADEPTPAATAAAAYAANSPPAATASQPQQQQQPSTWVIDREPSQISASTGLGFLRASAPAVAAAVSAAEDGCTVAAADRAGGTSAPLYDRAPVHFGLGFGSGLGFVQQQSQPQQKEDMQQQTATVSMADTGTAAVAGVKGAAEVGRSSSRQGSEQLQALEDKFAALRAAPNPAAAKRQQQRQQRQQQQQQPKLEARLAAPNTALGPAVAAATAAAAGDGDESGDEGSAGMTVTLGMTAQQVKKAKKQQLRNQRRESRSAAAAAADEAGQAGAPAAAAAAAVGNVAGSFAGFEAHTRGIGSRLMAGWGWREGEGLGRARQGRPEPLQAVRRERQLGLGAE